MFPNPFFVWEGQLHVLAENGHTTLCGHEKPKKAKTHNDMTAAPICEACLAKSDPDRRAWFAKRSKLREEPLVKPYKPGGLKERQHVKPLAGQTELF